MKIFILHFFIIVLLFTAVSLSGDNDSAEASYNKIKNCFSKNEFSGLEPLFPDNRKIHLFLPKILPKSGYFTSQQIHYLLKDMEKSITTDDFVYEKEGSASENASSKKARWKLKKDGETMDFTIFFYLEKINNKWKLLQIKSS
ncbi:MAG: hypothetical protein A2Y62_13955 [Candidatus Fischerbacteria bacterium RBG_13_37_8]|uniref:DUF4440 domain-containing protein n=1 Tax=Candidatus Fischerbacteria bacterium RBG_13_37_8 TaxID=1817863 RepID=A0A1F5V6K9_9BACT|nr:MAG: hypothetical protein A2Y62_13955 [Candidatus Fischerbacteria bacterium RBG_13_37_8]